MGKIFGRYLMLEIFLYIELDDIMEKLFRTSLRARQYIIENHGALLKRADSECEDRDVKKGLVKVDLSKEADWAYMRLNYSKYRRQMNYEVTAHSFDDAVHFMSKVAQKDDHRKLIRITALKITLRAERPQHTFNDFKNFFN